MKLQLLHNWCKKLGFFLFIIGVFIEGRDAFIEGLTGKPYRSLQDIGVFTFREYFGENLIHLFSLISLTGMVVYMLSREKVEDDYIDKLRLESFQITSLIGLGVTILLYAVAKDIKLTLDYFIILYLLIYLFTFFKKNACTK